MRACMLTAPASTAGVILVILTCPSFQVGVGDEPVVHSDEQKFSLWPDKFQQPATFALDYSWEFLPTGGILKLLEVEPEIHAAFLV